MKLSSEAKLRSFAESFSVVILKFLFSLKKQSRKNELFVPS